MDRPQPPPLFRTTHDASSTFIPLRRGVPIETVNAEVQCHSGRTIMPHRLCAVCRIEGTLLEGGSKDSMVDYFKCRQCGRVWTHPKPDPKAEPHSPVKS
jgi:hypothetical protein